MDLSKLRVIDGFVGGSLVDINSGMELASEGSENFPLEIAAAGNTQVLRAKRRTLKSLGLEDQVEDINIFLADQIHILRPLTNGDTIFLYVVLDRKVANFALARKQIHEFERKLELI